MYKADGNEKMLEQRLQQLQYPDEEECQAPGHRYLIYFQHKDNGMGSEIHCMQLALTAACIIIYFKEYLAAYYV
jgi:hypothetical protein